MPEREPAKSRFWGLIAVAVAVPAVYYFQDIIRSRETSREKNQKKLDEEKRGKEERKGEKEKMKEREELGCTVVWAGCLGARGLEFGTSFRDSERSGWTVDTGQGLEAGISISLRVRPDSETQRRRRKTVERVRSDGPRW